METNLPAAEQPEAATEQTHEQGSQLLQHNHQHGPTLNPELMREIEVEVPADEVSKAFRTVTKRYQKLARIPGFRAGKVPESLIKTKFAKEVRQEVLEILVADRFQKAIEEQKLTPASQPQMVDMQLFDGQPLRFKAAFEVLPEINIAGYDSEKIEKPETALSEEEYEAELTRVLDAHATVETVEEDRTLVNGDWAEIEFKGQMKDLAETVTEEGEGRDRSTEPITGEDVLVEVGGKNTLPAFNDALNGAKPGQELTFEVTYPADFGEPRLAGQTVAYDVTVKTIKKQDLPRAHERVRLAARPVRDVGGVRDRAARDGSRTQAGGPGEPRQGHDAEQPDRALPVPCSRIVRAAADRRSPGPRPARSGAAGHEARGHAQAGLRPSARGAA